jgi:hypothetical protein
VGLLAGTFLSALGAALQFSREATEATPTALLWAVAAAFLLEGARTGRAWAWAGAGLAGGFSLYFYPPGRLWPALAALFGIALFLRGPRGVRGRIALGLSIAAIAALAIMGPFLQHSIRGNTFTIRAKETSVLVREGRGRLPWDRPEWSLPRFLVAQADRSFGIFNRYGDNNFFWPADHPILPGALSVLALVGLGAATLKVRDPRMVLLVVWFWLGFVGVIVTVETPALQRMAGAIPVLCLFPALVLDDLVRRLSALAEVAGGPARRAAAWAATAAAFLVAAALTAREARYYFVEYGERKEPWWYPNLEGQTVAAQGSDSWVLGVGPHQHKLASGWVRFLAPTTPKGGLRYPGSVLPIAIPASRDLTFFVYRDQLDYLPYLKDVYPGGFERRIKPDENVWFATYRVPRAAWRAMQGARVAAAGAAPVRVDRLGEPPPGAPRSSMRWTAALRAPRSGNYAFRAGPGPARLYVDGTLALNVPDGAPSSVTTLGLVRGDHFVVLEAIAGGAGRDAVVEWAVPEETPRETPRFSPVPTACLEARDRPPGGLLGVVTAEGRPEQKRMDRTLATSSLSHQLGLPGPFAAVWTGTLTAPGSGLYRFTFRSEGAEIELSVDGRALPEPPRKKDEPAWREVSLAAGPHAVRVGARVASGPGALEWTWQPPGGPVSIVPPSVLAPPERSGAGPPFPPEALGPWSAQPRDEVFTPQR